MKNTFVKFHGQLYSKTPRLRPKNCKYLIFAGIRRFLTESTHANRTNFISTYTISCACCVSLQPSSHPFCHPFGKTLERRISWSNSQIGFAYRQTSWCLHSQFITNIVVWRSCESCERLHTILVVVSLFRDITDTFCWFSTRTSSRENALSTLI